MHPAVGLLISYVAGSFPSAYLAGRLLKGIDLRTVGSGNLGATNVYRVLGLLPAVIVLVIDGAKGALPVYFLPRLLHADSMGGDAALWWALGYGIAAIVGHTRSVFLLLKGGGKGVATAAGVFVVLVPFALILSTSLCAVAVWFTGYMSVGSVVAALTFPIVVGIDRGVASPVFLVSLAVCGFILWGHRSNVARLRAGTEHRLFRKVEKQP